MTSEVMQPNSLLNFSSVKIRGHDLPSGTERILCSCGQERARHHSLLSTVLGAGRRELAGPVLRELTGWQGQLGKRGVGAVMETRLVEFGLDSTLTLRTQQVWKWGSPRSDLEAPHHQCWAHQRWNMMQVWFPGGAWSGRVLMFNTGVIFYLVRKTLLRLTLQNSVCLRTLVSLAGSSPRPILVALPWHGFLTFAPAERHGPLGFWVSFCELASGPRNRFFFF